jgi:hypothetical protein
MSNELEKIIKFMTIKRDTVEETINDVRSTKFAIFLIAIAMALAVIQTLLQGLVVQDVLELIWSWMGFVPPSPLRIVLDSIFSNIVFPLLVIILAFYIGNAIKGEAESLNHVVRAVGYSTPPLIISSAFSFLGLTGNPWVIVVMGFFNFVFGLWFVIVIVFALMITFKKGALTGIGAIAISAIIAGIATGWVVLIP